MSIEARARFDEEAEGASIGERPHACAAEGGGRAHGAALAGLIMFFRTNR